VYDCRLSGMMLLDAVHRGAPRCGRNAKPLDRPNPYRAATMANISFRKDQGQHRVFPAMSLQFGPQTLKPPLVMRS
jgi:hypothetical protein